MLIVARELLREEVAARDGRATALGRLRGRAALVLTEACRRELVTKDGGSWTPMVLLPGVLNLVLGALGLFLPATFINNALEWGGGDLTWASIECGCLA